MTDEQKKQIFLLRKTGLGYKAISNMVGLSRDSVRSFCKNHGMSGYIGPAGEVMKKIKSGDLCQYCGGKIIKAKTGRPARFCSTECRRAYWKTHRDEGNRSWKAIYIKECKYCHTPFESYGNKKRKYCCHAHYIFDRFGDYRFLKEEFKRE